MGGENEKENGALAGVRYWTYLVNNGTDWVNLGTATSLGERNSKFKQLLLKNWLCVTLPMVEGLSEFEGIK